MVVLDYLARMRYSAERSRYAGKSPKETFMEIYEQKGWGDAESVSGPGSSLHQTADIVRGIEKIIKDHEIKSMLDIPCGDFHWMQHTNRQGVEYIGADLIPELIAQNEASFAGNGCSFQILDLIEDTLPIVDLVLVRDCFVHFSYEYIERSIQNLKNSGSTYLLATTFTRHHLNHDITTGDWRPINLEVKPFDLPKPLTVIAEHVEAGFEREFKGKSLALWRIADL